MNFWFISYAWYYKISWFIMSIWYY